MHLLAMKTLIMISNCSAIRAKAVHLSWSLARPLGPLWQGEPGLVIPLLAAAAPTFDHVSEAPWQGEPGLMITRNYRAMHVCLERATIRAQPAETGSMSSRLSSHSPVLALISHEQPGH